MVVVVSKMAVNIRLAVDRKTKKQRSNDLQKSLVTPGDIITSDPSFMRGHGTYFEEDQLLASVAGVVEKINRLISVRPLKTRYNGEIGDIVIGRITEVQQKRWKVETNSRLDSILALSSVNLPGGELRRRGAEDELMMRQYLNEGDLISAEVQQIHGDGCLSLHTRSLRYGKLSQGTLVRVSPSLVKRRKTHFHNLPCGASVILGNNGFIWIGPIMNEEREGGSGNFVLNLEPVSRQERETIAMLRNCILALSSHQMQLYDTSITYAYDVAQKYQVKDLLQPDVIDDVAELTRLRLAQDDE